MPFVYILENGNGKYYIGSTTNLDRRMVQHWNGHTPSTKRLGTLNLIFFQEYSTLGEAKRIERKLKAFRSKNVIRKIIKDGIILWK